MRFQTKSYKEAFITAIKGILATTPRYITKDIVVGIKDLTFPTFNFWTYPNDLKFVTVLHMENYSKPCFQDRTTKYS